MRALPFVLLALLLGAAGFLAGAVADPFGPTATAVRGDLAPEAPRLTRQLADARQRADSLARRLDSAQTRIDTLERELADARARIDALRQRAERAQAAQSEAENRIAELSRRLARLERRSTPADPAGTTDDGDGDGDGDGGGGGNAGRDAPGDAPDAAAGPVSAPGADGQPLAAARVRVPSEVPDDPRPSAEALEPLAPNGAQGQQLLAGVALYRAGEYDAAYRAWLPLAKDGYARAQLHLGGLFFEGRGTERDDPLAYAWLAIAEQNGSANAPKLLEQLRARMSAAQLERARQLIRRARSSASSG